jgi:N-acetylmuramoyl-L-alanine amidase
MVFRERVLPALIALLACACAGAALAASDWQIVKVGGREYLTLDNIAHFYGLPRGVTSAEKRVRLANDNNSLEVQLDSREIVINGARSWLCFPVLEKDGQYLISRVDLSKTIEPQLRPQMIPNLGALKTVVLDPGHGGYDKGAVSAYGYEKDFALDVARDIKPLLEAKGLEVKMTRNSDVFVPLELRARIANGSKDAIFVSIHFNATDANPAANGFEIFSLTPRGAPSTADDALALRFLNMQAGSPVDAPSLALSMSVYHSLLGHFSEFDRGIKRARFAVLRLTKIPAVLVEGGFLTERGESRLIARSAWREKLGQSIATGILGYKELVDNKTRPMMVADYRRELEGALVLKDATTPAKPDASPAPSVIPASN